MSCGTRMHRFASLFLCCAFVLSAGAQGVRFEPITINGVSGHANGFLELVDMDQDGDLDLFVGGSRGPLGGPVPGAALVVGYDDQFITDQEQEKSPPVPAYCSLPGDLTRGKPFWERCYEPFLLPVSVVEGRGLVLDADHDNDPDYALDGRSNGASTLAVVLGDPAWWTGQGGVLLERPGYAQAAFAAGDIDQDGWTDLLVSGGQNGMNAGALAYGSSEGFAFEPAPLAPITFAAAELGDIDNDDDLDLVAVGEGESGAFVSYVLRNENGSFGAPADGGIAPLAFADMELGDYDADGDLDLALIGARLDPTGLRGVLQIYENVGGSFRTAYEDLDAVFDGEVSWGDYDNDGQLELLASGRVASVGGAAAIVLQRTAGRWEPASDLQPTSLHHAAVAWGDYEDDGDLDMIIMGYGEGGVGVVEQRRNESAPPNAAPSAPEGPSAEVAVDRVRLSWSASADDHTPSAGLSYNVRVGRVPGGTAVVSPLADLATGRRYVVGRGNAGQDRSFTLRGLEPGTYFWSVQAIDGAYKGSPFSAEQRFVVP